MNKRQTLKLVGPDHEALTYAWLVIAGEHPERTVGEFLREHPAFSLTPLTEAHLALPVGRVSMSAIAPAPDVALFLPPGIDLPGVSAETQDEAADGTAPSGETGSKKPGDLAVDGSRRATSVAERHPVNLTEKEAVHRAHEEDMAAAAAYLDGGLSVLVRCEKLLVEHLATEIAFRSGRPQHLVRITGGADARGAGIGIGGGPVGGGRRAALLAQLQEILTKAPHGDVIVVPHLDLLAGGSDAALSTEGREVTDLLYERSGAVLLGFVDPSMVVPEVLANRFAVRLAIDILPREILSENAVPIPIGRALVTQEEAQLFAGFDPTEFYKHVAGMNAVRLRHALRFAAQRHRPNPGRGGPAAASDGRPAVEPTFATLVDELRQFKARTSTASFDVPNVPFKAIGGYDDVKLELQRALDIVGGSVELPEHLRHDLVPRGFVLHGPPGTGKTLFAKAIATELKGTIQVVSGPEITDMYVGESERKIRELFAEARRNAPAVLVFDEFDSIAGQRSGRDDGGSRAGNAIVAQLLTELDGFRPEVPVIIIGTTNRIDLIDVALLRPSRFRPIKIDLPNEVGRREIARWHAGVFGVDVSDQLLKGISQATDGLNGDELRSVFRDARADQLVGQRKGLPIGPYRLGELVGQLLRAKQQQELDRAGTAGGPVGTGTSVTLSLDRSFTLLAGIDDPDEAVI